MNTQHATNPERNPTTILSRQTQSKNASISGNYIICNAKINAKRNAKRNTENKKKPT